MKKATPQYQQSSPSQGQNNADVAFESLKKRMFPERARHCFECNTKLTSSNRRRMVTFQAVAMGVLASGHQVCSTCASKLENTPHLMHKIRRDLLAARFEQEGESLNCMGGEA